MRNIKNNKRGLVSSEKKAQSGFTIIEVLIVLAIAGLIMVIVFLAVPALQRNNRNTQRKADVNAVITAVNDHISNRNGALPTAVADYNNNVNYGFYTAGNVTQAAGAQAAVTDENASIRVVTGAKCADSFDGTTVAGTTRQFAVQYAVETRSGRTSNCQNG